MGGLGLGLGYVTPVAAVTKWFPDRRGLGSGLVVGGFGLGAFGYAHLLRSFPAFSGGAGAASGPAVLQAFTISGVAFALLGGAGALLVRNPPAASPAAAVAAGGVDFTPGAMARTPQFWAAFGMLFLNVTAGILFISNAVPIMRELTGAAPAVAAGVYGTIALANALGRFLWGAVSDRIGRRAAFAAIYLLQVAVFVVVGRLHSMWVVAPLFALVLLCYGGGFGVMPSLVADWFGTRHLGVNYGWVLLAWSLAGVAGPGFVAMVKDRTGSFAGALPVTAGVLALAVLLPLLARAPRAYPRRHDAPPQNGSRRAISGVRHGVPRSRDADHAKDLSPDHPHRQPRRHRGLRGIAFGLRDTGPTGPRQPASWSACPPSPPRLRQAGPSRSPPRSPVRPTPGSPGRCRRAPPGAR